MNSKRKGCAGEREFAGFLRDHGFHARRGQQFHGGPDSPDVVAPDLGFHVEVKRVEKLNLRDATAQAEGDCGGRPWIVAHRWNHGHWLVTMRAEAFLDVLREALPALPAAPVQQSDLGQTPPTLSGVTQAESPEPTTTEDEDMSALVVSAKAESNIEPVEEGLHLAACVALYELGTLYNEKFDVAQRKCVLTFELPNLPHVEVERDGQRVKLPRCLSRRFTMSLNEKAALRAFLESWRGKRFTEPELAGFDLSKLLGVPVQLQVMHATGGEGRTYANITNAVPAPRGTKITPATPLTIFSMADLKEAKLPAGLPEWVGKLVMESREWERLTKRAATAAPAAATPATAPAPQRIAAAETAAVAAVQPDEDDIPF